MGHVMMSVLLTAEVSVFFTLGFMAFDQTPGPQV